MDRNNLRLRADWNLPKNNKQYCLLTKYLIHSTRIDGRLIPSSTHTLCSIGAGDIAVTRKEAKYSCLVCRLPTAFRPRQVVSIERRKERIKKHVFTQWRNYNFWTAANILYGLTVLIHNSGHFEPPLSFWAHGPPALPGLPMASYATVFAPLRWKDWERFCGFHGQQRKQNECRVVSACICIREGQRRRLLIGCVCGSAWPAWRSYYPRHRELIELCSRAAPFSLHTSQ